MKQKIIIIISAVLIVFSTVFYVVELVTSNKAEDEDNNAWVRSYLYGYFTDSQKSDILDEINIDAAGLNTGGFDIYRDDYMISNYDKKTLMTIRLAFENIYCDVEILYSKKEIEWEKERNLTREWQMIAVGERAFKHKDNTLVFEDWEREKIYYFYCGMPYTDNLYQEFLAVFFKEAV